MQTIRMSDTAIRSTRTGLWPRPQRPRRYIRLPTGGAEHTEGMSIEKPPAGTRGGRTAPSLVNKLLMPVMMRIHRRGGDRFQGMDLLYITTVGARSGRQRTNPVARFEDGQGGWYVVASASGAARHPA